MAHISVELRNVLLEDPIAALDPTGSDIGAVPELFQLWDEAEHLIRGEECVAG